jgi:methanogenic corrinoid protein MtbC1
MDNSFSAIPRLSEAVKKQFTDGLLAGDIEGCRATTMSALDSGADPWLIYQDLFRPALYRVGELWACNQISVASEHLATAVVEQLMIDLYPHFAALASTQRKVVLATVEEELHRIGLRMTADVFDSHGWEPSIANTGCSTDGLVAVIEREHPDAVGISCSVAFHLETLVGMLETLQVRFPNLPLLLGGQAFVSGEGAELEALPSVTVIPDLQALNAWILAFDRLPSPQQALETGARQPVSGPTTPVSPR